MSSQSVPVERWFYHSEGKEHGPISFRKLRHLALEGALLPETKIWQLNNNVPQRAADIKGLLPDHFTRPAQANQADRDSQSAQSSSTRPQRSILDGPPGGLYLPHLKPASFTVHLSTLIGVILLTYFGSQIPEAEMRIPVLFLAGLSGLAFIILSFVYLHRAWEMLRTVGAPFSGKQAIKGMALPIVNTFTSFSIIYGWSKCWNHQIKTHPGFSTTSAVFRGTSLMFCLGFLTSQALLAYLLITQSWPHELSSPLREITFGTWGMTLIFGLATWADFSRKINFLAKKKS